ncbi:hypothetical protein KSF_078040 [Reticulibacter mediterranei]|uniref:Uncharacterized protein n=1 Tax=Reticulibacter mediterranei TaxID=2778369 RepID=A0A8J3IXA0_9CHLR|nr:hypothetical protein [Reticulibacter mediterranei]GHO97756.1 hypothetical protein KSF_078040 [Reticulibacter mediterranei]
MNAFQQSLLWGAILGIFRLITLLIGSLIIMNSFGNFIFSSITFTITMVFYVFIGLLASQETGRAGTGAMIGFLTGIFSSIIASIGTIILAWTNATEMHQRMQDLANQLHLSGNAAVPLLSLLLFAVVILGGFILSPGLGALAGAIGGAIGKRQAKNEEIDEGIPEYYSGGRKD